MTEVAESVMTTIRKAMDKMYEVYDKTCSEEFLDGYYTAMKDMFDLIEENKNTGGSDWNDT